MRIQLLKAQLVGKVNHEQGDTVEIDEQRGKALVKKGVALEIKVNADSNPRPEPIKKREAALRPRGRRAVQEV